MKRKRRVFQNSEPAYRAFLTKFSENKTFNDDCIILALNHAFSQIFQSQISSDVTKVHLVKVVLDNKDKILKDLEILQDSPDSKIEPLKAKKKQSNIDIDKVTKKRKLDSASCSQEVTTHTLTNDYNTANSSKRSTKRSSSGNRSLLTNLQDDDKENQCAGLTSKILKVTIENDINLQQMVKSCIDSKNNKEKPNKSFESNTEENNWHEKINEKENEKFNAAQDYNDGIEIEQSIFRIDENDTSLLRIEGVCIKKETDLLDQPLQRDTPILLPEETTTATSEDACNNAAGRSENQDVNSQINISNSSNSLSVSSQENVSSLNIACYNNFIPSVQSCNNGYQMPHMNYYPCQFMHHHMFMNNQFGCCCCGMYNFPMVNPFFSHYDHADAALQNRMQAPSTNQYVENGSRTTNHVIQTNQMKENRPMNQSLFHQNSIKSMQANQIMENSPVSSINADQPVQFQTNQIAGNNSPHQPSNTAQQIAKLQTAIFNLNSQLASLKNAWNQSQIDSSCVNRA